MTTGNPERTTMAAESQPRRSRSTCSTCRRSTPSCSSWTTGARSLPELAALAELGAEARRAAAHARTSRPAPPKTRARAEAHRGGCRRRRGADHARHRAAGTSASVKDVAASSRSSRRCASARTTSRTSSSASWRRVEEREAALARPRRPRRLDGRIAEASRTRDAALASIGSERAHAEANRQTIAAKLAATTCSRSTRSSAHATASAHRCCRAGSRWPAA